MSVADKLKMKKAASKNEISSTSMGGNKTCRPTVRPA
jgi:hypothetical protein